MYSLYVTNNIFNVGVYVLSVSFLPQSKNMHVWAYWKHWSKNECCVCVWPMRNWHPIQGVFPAFTLFVLEISSSRSQWHHKGTERSDNGWKDSVTMFARAGLCTLEGAVWAVMHMNVWKRNVILHHLPAASKQTRAEGEEEEKYPFCFDYQCRTCLVRLHPHLWSQ